MITEGLLDFIEAVIVWVISLVPDFELPWWLTDGSFSSALTDVGSKVAPVAVWAPIAVLAAVVPLVWFVQLVMVGVQLGMKIYAMVRGGAS